MNYYSHYEAIKSTTCMVNYYTSTRNLNRYSNESEMKRKLQKFSIYAVITGSFLYFCFSFHLLIILTQDWFLHHPLGYCPHPSMLRYLKCFYENQIIYINIRSIFMILASKNIFGLVWADLISLICSLLLFDFVRTNSVPSFRPVLFFLNHPLTYFPTAIKALNIVCVFFKGASSVNAYFPAGIWYPLTGVSQ